MTKALIVTPAEASYTTSGTCPNCLRSTLRYHDADTGQVIDETCDCYDGARPKHNLHKYINDRPAKVGYK